MRRALFIPMVDLAKVASQNIVLTRDLARFDKTSSANLVAGLLTLPDFYANTLRIEVMVHLCVRFCNGSEVAKKGDLRRWFNILGRDCWLADMEDPIEDVYVSVIMSKWGSYRVYSGLLADGDYILNDLIGFLSEKGVPTFMSDGIGAVVSILKISDAIINRTKVDRYHKGGGIASSRINVPGYAEKLPSVLFFSTQDLDDLGVNERMLNNFILNDDLIGEFSDSLLGRCVLDRRPIVRMDGGIAVILPSRLVTASIVYLLDFFNGLNGVGFVDIFYQKRQAEFFVNDIRRSLKIDPYEFKLTSEFKGVGDLFPYVGVFDYGKPVLMLTRCSLLSEASKLFCLAPALNEALQENFELYLRSCFSELSKIPGFTSGLVLISSNNFGDSDSLKYPVSLDGWVIHAATNADWEILSADGECTASRLWKLGKLEKLIDENNVELVNIGGLVNYFSYWRSNEFRILPRDADFSSGGMIVLQSSYAANQRILIKNKLDSHCLPWRLMERFVSLRRMSIGSLFKEDDDMPNYFDTDAVDRGELVGCVNWGCGIIWVACFLRPEDDSKRDLVYKLWDCVKNWTARVGRVLCERNLSFDEVTVTLNFENLNKWVSVPTYNELVSKSIEELKVDVVKSNSSIGITIVEGFMRMFNMADNLAERKIVKSIVAGLNEISSWGVSIDDCSDIVESVMRNNDARYFHIVRSQSIEQEIGLTGDGEPVFPSNEDIASAGLGIAHAMGSHSHDIELGDLNKSSEYLKKIVELLWERIEMKLSKCNRISVIRLCFAQLDEISLDELRWKISSRANFALHEDSNSVHDVINERRSNYAKASLGARLIVETSQYACKNDSASPISIITYGELLAEFTLLLEYASYRDAIAYGFMSPRILIHRNGELGFDRNDYLRFMNPYLTRRLNDMNERASRDYDKNFESTNDFENRNENCDADLIRSFNSAFVPEYGFDIKLMGNLINLLADFAIKYKSSCSVIEDAVMCRVFLRAGFNEKQRELFLDKFVLPIRDSWCSDLPDLCRDRDVFPWRFRRQLSLLMRPVIEISKNPRRWFISFPLLENSFRHMVANMQHGYYPANFFASQEMRAYVGTVSGKRGGGFTNDVYLKFIELGFSVKKEIELTEVGAPKNGGYGDVDVLAWDVRTSTVYFIECKCLLPAITTREVIQRMEDFKGDVEARDSWGKHLRRYKWICENAGKLASYINLDPARIVIEPLLVVSETVPMQFFSKFNIKVNQIISYDDIGAFVARIK